MEYLKTDLKANEAVCPQRTLDTGIRLRCIDFTGKGTNSPTELGPSNKVSLALMVPESTVPDTTVPTPSTQ